MNDTSKKPSVSTNEKNVPSASQEPWRPFDTLRRQVDRLFDDFERPWHLPSAVMVWKPRPCGRVAPIGCRRWT